MKKWERILKMPVPIDTGDKRDEDYKQKIIEYEKTVVEPELTAWVQSDTALKGFTVYFKWDTNDDKTEFTIGDESGNFWFGNNDVEKLGGNFRYILQVLGEIYSQEGYNTEMTGAKVLMVTKG